MPIARTSGRLVAALLVLALGLAAVAGPASAAVASPDPARPDVGPDATAAPEPYIIGGTKAPAGAWPSVVALLYGSGAGSSQVCGGTIIDPSWVLTAAHCVSNGPRHVRPARMYQVLVGTQSLTSGGQRIPVAQIIVRPEYSERGISNDVALLRLARPTDRPRPLEVASPTDVPWSGAPLMTAGWGQSDVPGEWSPADLRQVEVPAMDPAECNTALTEATSEWGTPPYHSSHLCTGPIGSGGRGPCYGDSGGPLVWERNGRKILVGVVSWGAFCGSPETPSVFSKVASASRWIAKTIQYGPHWDGEEFAFALSIAYLDFDPNEGPGDLPPAGEPGAQIAALHGEPVVTRRDGKLVRLYEAVLGRRTELYGYQYWRDRLFHGESEYSFTRVAEVMTRSAEFRTEYGNLGDQDFVERIYLNLLGRDGTDGDVDYWTGRLGAGATRGQVVLLIAESAENRARSQAEVDVQVAFLNLMNRVPAQYELDQWAARPLAELGRFIVHSVAYARLWRDGF